MDSNDVMGLFLERLNAACPRRKSGRLVKLLLVAVGREPNVLVLRLRGTTKVFRIYDEGLSNFCECLAEGSAALMHGYSNGLYDTPDLYELLLALWSFQRVVRFFSPAKVATQRKAGTRGNNRDVALHYDLPVELFHSFLGSHMAYSSTSTSSGFANISLSYKQSYQQILAELNLSPRSLVIDLGCGWGAFLKYVLATTDHDVIGVTISPTQADFISKQINSKRCSILLGDFTEASTLPSEGDGLVLMESLEHVDPCQRTSFLRMLRKQYPTSRVVIQATTVSPLDRILRGNRSTVLTSVVFPGPGQIPDIRSIRTAASAAHYRVLTVRDISTEYRDILLSWFTTFEVNKNRLHHFPSAFIRAWSFYLAGLASANESGRTHSFQILMEPL